VPDDDFDFDFEAYLRYLHERNIAPAVQRYRPSRHGPFEHEEFEYPLWHLARANSVLRLTEGVRDIYEIVRPAILTQTLRDISAGAEANASLADELGFSEVLDSDFATIARRMTPAMLPPEEADLLRQLGFPDAAEALPFMVLAGRERAEATSAQYREVRPSRAMRTVPEVLEPAISDHERLEALEEEVADLRRSNEKPYDRIRDLENEIRSIRKPRRWWNAARKVIEGVATSLADIGAATGVGSRSRLHGCPESSALPWSAQNEYTRAAPG
jgi:hypothetical protein